MVQAFMERKNGVVDFTIEIRADKRVAFSNVEPAMEASALAIKNGHIDVSQMPIKMDLTAMMGGN